MLFTGYLMNTHSVPHQIHATQHLRSLKSAHFKEIFNLISVAYHNSACREKEKCYLYPRKKRARKRGHATVVGESRRYRTHVSRKRTIAGRRLLRRDWKRYFVFYTCEKHVLSCRKCHLKNDRSFATYCVRFCPASKDREQNIARKKRVPGRRKL